MILIASYMETELWIVYGFISAGTDSKPRARAGFTSPIGWAGEA